MEADQLSAGAVAVGNRAPSVADVLALLAAVPVPADGPGKIGQMREFEDVKSAVAAKQARLSVAYDLDVRRAQTAAGVPADEIGAGVGTEIALARREPPARGARLLGLATALVVEMPHTLGALETGQLSEWRATLVVKETACLSAADRAAVDEDIAADTGTLNGCGDRAITAAVRAAAYRRDPRSVAKRASHAVNERCVTLRPAPDTMAYLTALVPIAQGVAAYTALTRHADALKSAGDERPRGAIMADALVERLTGTPGGITGVEIQLVMTDRTLFQGDNEPARLTGYGTVPAASARETILPGPPAGAGNQGHQESAGPRELNVWLRRLYTAPSNGDLVAMDSKARLFPPGLRRFLQARDDTCRTPYCDAPIRHHDHIIPWHQDGPTTGANGQGLCETCNHTKETPGWTTHTITAPDQRHTVETRTPTGHTYESTAPPLPGTTPAREAITGVSPPVSVPERARPAREGPAGDGAAIVGIAAAG